MIPGSAAGPAWSFSRRLVWLANGLLAAYAIQVVITSLMPHASLSAALLALCAEIADRAFLPSLAIALLYGATALDPQDHRLARRCHREREVRLLVGLLVLVLPVQVLAGWGELRGIQAEQGRASLVIEARQRQVRQAILAATSAAVLQADLKALEAPPLPPAFQPLPLPLLKQRLLVSLDGAERLRRRQAGIVDPHQGSASTRLLWRVLQTALLAIVYGVGLIAGSPRLRVLLAATLPSRRSQRMQPSAPGSLGVDRDYFEAISRDEASAEPERRP